MVEERDQLLKQKECLEQVCIMYISWILPIHCTLHYGMISALDKVHFIMCLVSVIQEYGSNIF